MKKKYLFLCLMLAWAAFIFCRSLQPARQSGVESMWVLRLLYRLFPFRPTINQVRKAAHFIEFAVLGGLSATLSAAVFRRLAFWRKVLFALVISGFTALCDETIQLFVEGRSGQVRDIWIDISGALTGAVLMVCLFGIGNAVRKRRETVLTAEEMPPQAQEPPS